MTIFNMAEISRILTNDPRQIRADYSGKMYREAIDFLQRFENKFMRIFGDGNKNDMVTIEENELLQHALDFIGDSGTFPSFIDYVADKELFTDEEIDALDSDIEKNFPYGNA